jgi:hypothetical protein
MNESLVVSIVLKNGFVKAMKRVFRFGAFQDDYGIVGYLENYDYTERVIVMLENGPI